MTRFQILAIIAGQNQALTCAEIAELSGRPGWYTRSFRASLATRLRKLWKWGLLRRDLHPWNRAAHSRQRPYAWRLSARGRQRLSWARSEGKVN
jgi:hypothetical protein